ncbi:hypothetical protein SK128_014219 [Halocaridina rubra]|uniref:Glycerate kinase n=1 Tax=Halocaridina rubra TaxID=373956 RepID=A0AAN9FUE4_HALRR
MASKHLGNSILENIGRIKRCFMEGVNAVQPHELIAKVVTRENNTLIINHRKYELNENVYIVGFGKAVIGMVQPLESLLRRPNTMCHLKEGIISVPYGIFRTLSSKATLLPPESSLIEVMEGAKDNIPDEDAFSASKKITDLVKKLRKDDLLIVLISGGGSALLPYPLPHLTLVEKIDIIISLSKSGATITELNTVRKALSEVKGGKLAEMCKANIVSLIISDVINSPLDIIASGPTVMNQDAAGAALNVVKKYNIPIGDSVRLSLANTFQRNTPEHFTHVDNIIMGDNETALAAVNKHLISLPNSAIVSVILSSSLQGEASSVGVKIAEFATAVTKLIANKCDMKLIESLLNGICDNSDRKSQAIDAVKKVYEFKCPIWFVFGGETTVRVRGRGRGGRNQEIVLSASITLEKEMPGSSFVGEILFLSGGTDGIDGPTDAAGAVTYWMSAASIVSSQYQEAKNLNLSPESYLKNNDSYTYFSELNCGEYLLKPGHTGTNVMDIQLLLIVPDL